MNQWFKQKLVSWLKFSITFTGMPFALTGIFVDTCLLYPYHCSHNYTPIASYTGPCATYTNHVINTKLFPLYIKLDNWANN